MAKPKKKRDLRARLGRTITPKTKGGGGAAPAGKEGVAPPNLGDDSAKAATPAPKGVTPPPAGVAKPPAGLGAKPSKGVAAPPFAQPKAAPASDDPFAAAPAQGPQVVRLEFDDKAVSEAEVGKKRPFTLIIVSLVVLAVGLGVGAFAGSTYENNKIFDRTVRDAQDIHASVSEASETVEAAQRHVNALVTAAAGNEQEGTDPHVDYDAIEALRALEKPFDAHAFSNKNYGAFTPQVVNDLFDYLMNIQELWNDFRGLAAQTLPEARRAELDRTAGAVGEAANAQYGAVLSVAEDGRVFGSLAFLEPGEEGAIMARATRGGQGREFQLYTGVEQEIAESPEFVLLINNQTSRGVLAEQMGAFRQYLQQIRDIKTKIDQTVEIQGRLLTAIAAALSEAGASVTRSGGE